MIITRRAREKDVKDIIQLADLIFRINNNLKPSMGIQFPFLLSEKNASNLLVAEDDGRIISHVGIKIGKILVNGCWIPIASMGSVCTHPDYRRRNIAGTLVDQAMEMIQEKGVYLLTISGSLPLYTGRGAVFTGGIRKYFLNKENVSSTLSIDVSIEEINDENISVFSALYQSENIRYERTKDEFTVLYRAYPMVATYPANKAGLLARTHDGRPLAYVICHFNNDRCVITEYAGSRIAVNSIVKHILTRYTVNSVEIDINMYETEFIQLYRGIQSDERYCACTYLIVNPQKFIDVIDPILKERNYDKPLDELMKDRSEFTHFVFDYYNRKDYGNMDGGVFPIPLPSPVGLNYI
ncbi:Acetyltransferase (GNAT) domain-containing protein [Caldanaerobius fijiensis DSM 17918]|uniref:Acetyltransferase (GNAT) domain-containing protein n=1 Tax=Caldanaerobius fijiensis DSM 17918 TaxID=1121256 RepID=A0A1M5ER75_9THEO|nr:GNAT family N-acetyltransferase [Caldanaerobius fijiensis]SHF81788.1 Acetyltransferase (GNAT) domain-containing protein [Caldanaerobius fijiensis DSM 17918]